MTVSLDTIDTISEIAAGGAVAAVAIRFSHNGLRKLWRLAKQSDAQASIPRSEPLGDHDSEELTDAKLLGEALLGALITGFAAALYFGALRSFEDSWSGLEWAVIGFAPALWALMQLHREPLPGEPSPSDETHLRAWMGFVTAVLWLFVAAARFYH